MTLDVLRKLLRMLDEIQERIRLGRRRARRASGRKEGFRQVSDAARDLSRGSITLEQYLEVKIDQALDSLEGLLAPDDLELVRAILWKSVRTDPLYLALVESLRRVLSEQQLH